MARTCVVLLPGSGLGSWIWDNVVPELDPVLPIDYPAEAKKSWRLGDYADHVVAQIDQAAFGQVVLVGHSVGTVVALESAAKLGTRVEGVLSIAGVVPAPGESFLSAFPFPQRVITSALVRVLGTRPPESMLRSGLCLGLDERAAATVIERFEPESQRLFRDPIPTSQHEFARGYLHTSADKEVPVALQSRFSDRFDVNFRGEIETGHLPMIEAPGEMKAVIEKFVAGTH